MYFIHATFKEKTIINLHSLTVEIKYFTEYS